MDMPGKVITSDPPSSNKDNKTKYELDPMSFLHLDLITKMLMRESNNIYTDFKTKLEFIREQESLLLENERNLIAVHEIKDELNLNLLNIEEELRDSENYLIATETFVESVLQRASSCPRCGQYCHRENAHLLEMFRNCQASVTECNRLREEIDYFNQEALNHTSPWELIYKIFESHLKLIENAEIEVDKMEAKVEEIAKTYNELSTKFCEIDLGRSYLEE